MNSTAPHYLLFTQAYDSPAPNRSGGSWKFVLEEIGTDFRIEEGDTEPTVRGERLQLLAVIRGLEAIEQPSRVTLVTPSKFVGRGIRSGLRQWKANDWQWERFGEKLPINHVKLWQRIDAALQIHQISCRIWQFDVPHTRTQGHALDEARSTSPFVSAFAAAGENRIEQPERPRRNRIRVNEDLRKKFFEPCREAAQSVVDMLGDRVKPIGQGRAYGYAIN